MHQTPKSLPSKWPPPYRMHCKLNLHGQAPFPCRLCISTLPYMAYLPYKSIHVVRVQARPPASYMYMRPASRTSPPATAFGSLSPQLTKAGRPQMLPCQRHPPPGYSCAQPVLLIFASDCFFFISVCFSLGLSKFCNAETIAMAYST